MDDSSTLEGAGLMVSGFDAVTPPPIEPKKPKKGRYYAKALTEDDKDALSKGVINHNLKEWMRSEQMTQFHDARLELVHPGPLDQKAHVNRLMADREKTAATVAAMKKKEVHSSRFSLRPGKSTDDCASKMADFAQHAKQQQNARTFTPYSPPLHEHPRAENMSATLTRPTLGSRLSLAPMGYESSPQPSDAHVNSREPTSSATSESQFPSSCPSSAGSAFSFDGIAPSDTPAVKIVSCEAATRNDSYFLQMKERTTRSQLPSYPSNTGIRRRTRYIQKDLHRMSLAPGMRIPTDHQPRAEVTFDSFLAPDKSGKGLALPSEKPKPRELSPVKRPSSLRRFSGMSRKSWNSSSLTLTTVEEQATDGAAVDSAERMTSSKKPGKLRRRLSMMSLRSKK